VLAVLASDVRRAILVQLAKGPKDRRTLAEALGVSVAAVSHHLGRLLDHDLVRVEKAGRRHLYRLGRHATVIVGWRQAILNVSTPDGSQATVTFLLRGPGT
jgi:DNA-binding transcriptional ArsR family regulator